MGVLCAVWGWLGMDTGWGGGDVRWGGVGIVGEQLDLGIPTEMGLFWGGGAHTYRIAFRAHPPPHIAPLILPPIPNIPTPHTPSVPKSPHLSPNIPDHPSNAPIPSP